MLNDAFDVADFAVHPVLEGVEVLLGCESLIEVLLVAVHGDLDLVHDEFEADLVLHAEFVDEGLVMLLEHGRLLGLQVPHQQLEVLRLHLLGGLRRVVAQDHLPLTPVLLSSKTRFR